MKKSALSNKKRLGKPGASSSNQAAKPNWVLDRPPQEVAAEAAAAAAPAAAAAAPRARASDAQQQAHHPIPSAPPADDDVEEGFVPPPATVPAACSSSSAASAPAPATPPPELCCILTGNVFVDPVVDHEGHTYERTAIHARLAAGNTASPHTGTPLKKILLADNRVAKAAADAWRAGNAAAAAAQAAAPLPLPQHEDDVADAHVTAKLLRDTGHLWLSLKAPGAPSSVGVDAGAQRSRLPLTVVCSVDVSYSMRKVAEVKRGGGRPLGNGATHLDLVSHSISTTLDGMGPEDSLGIVTFNATAKVALPVCRMTYENKWRVRAVLRGLTPTGKTNLWDGVRVALGELERGAVSAGNANVVVFTDGRPTVAPPRAYEEMLRGYIDERDDGMPGVLHTVGFGYSLDSALLKTLAGIGGGTYSFIPDASLVGTVLVNSLANQLATCARTLVVNIEARDGLTLADGPGVVLGGYEHHRTSWGVAVNLGSAQYGQSRDVVLQLASAGDLGASARAPDDAAFARVVSASMHSLEEGRRVPLKVVACGDTDEHRDLMEFHTARLRAVDAVRAAHAAAVAATCSAQSLADATSAVRAEATLLRTSPSARHPYLHDLRLDLNGQVLEAFATADAFNRWGVHYLPSLYGAHLAQQCNNFKDPGVQHYGGGCFKNLVALLRAQFMNEDRPAGDERLHLDGFDIDDGIGLEVNIDDDDAGDLRCGARRRQSRVSLSSLPRTERAKKCKKAAGPASAARKDDRNWDMFFNAAGGCFAGFCTVAVAGVEGGRRRRVDEVRKGDRVATASGGHAEVLCVVRTAVGAGGVRVCRVGGHGAGEDAVVLTPFHPMLRHGEWVFPCSVDAGCMDTFVLRDAYVYDFVLSHGHDLLVNGTPCVTLGHGVATGAAAHSFFGSDAVVQDLRALPGYGEGEVTLCPWSFCRDPATQQVIGLQEVCVC
eukprot:Rhum_TRINITY_DN14772_c4_g8::Rhum_TRINITY_DN14772_c4_g8_i1::g.115885::m.115885